jgi:hypothetical protein
MSLPRVYAAINAVAAELARDGLAKGHINLEDQYAYRGIDDVYNRLGPVLARHKLCILPRVLKRTCLERNGALGDILLHVTLKVAFDFVSVEDGSRHTVKAFGEALDTGDKGTAKAMQSAFKYALLQAFCIPLGAEDADAASPRLKVPLHTPGPVQGWEQWAEDVRDMIRGCQSREALGRVQDRYRPMLTSLSRERADLYGTIGAAMAERRAELAAPDIAHGVRSSAADRAPCAESAAPECAPRAKQASPRKRASRTKPALETVDG